MEASEFEGPLFDVLYGMSRGAQPLARGRIEWDPKGFRPGGPSEIPGRALDPIRYALVEEPRGVHLRLAARDGWADALLATSELDTGDVIRAIHTATDAAQRWLRWRQLGHDRTRALAVAAFVHPADPDGSPRLHVHLVIPALQPGRTQPWRLDVEGMLASHAHGAQAAFDLALRYEFARHGQHRTQFGYDGPRIVATGAEPTPSDLVIKGAERQRLAAIDHPHARTPLTTIKDRPSLRDVLGRPRSRAQALDNAEHRGLDTIGSLDDAIVRFERANPSGASIDMIRTLVVHDRAPDDPTRGERPALGVPEMITDHIDLADVRAIAASLRRDPRGALTDEHRAWVRALAETIEPRWITAILGEEAVAGRVRDRAALVVTLREVGRHHEVDDAALWTLAAYRQHARPTSNVTSVALRQLQGVERPFRPSEAQPPTEPQRFPIDPGGSLGR